MLCLTSTLEQGMSPRCFDYDGEKPDERSSHITLDRHNAQERELVGLPAAEKIKLKAKFPSPIEDYYNTQRMADLDAIAPSITGFLDQLAPIGALLADLLQPPPLVSKEVPELSTTKESLSTEQSSKILDNKRVGRVAEDLHIPSHIFTSKRFLIQHQRSASLLKPSCPPASLSYEGHNVAVSEGTPNSRNLELGLCTLSKPATLSTPSPSTSVWQTSRTSCEGEMDTACQGFTPPSSRDSDYSDDNKRHKRHTNGERQK